MDREKAPQEITPEQLKNLIIAETDEIQQGAIVGKFKAGEAVVFIITKGFNLILTQRGHSEIRARRGLQEDQVAGEGYIKFHNKDERARVDTSDHHKAMSHKLIFAIEDKVTEEFGPQLK